MGSKYDRLLSFGMSRIGAEVIVRDMGGHQIEGSLYEVVVRQLTVVLVLNVDGGVLRVSSLYMTDVSEINGGMILVDDTDVRKNISAY